MSASPAYLSCKPRRPRRRVHTVLETGGWQSIFLMEVKRLASPPNRILNGAACVCLKAGDGNSVVGIVITISWIDLDISFGRLSNGVLTVCDKHQIVLSCCVLGSDALWNNAPQTVSEPSLIQNSYCWWPQHVIQQAAFLFCKKMIRMKHKHEHDLYAK